MTTNRGKSLTPGEATALVNGTETRTDWNSIPWKQCQKNVRRLRQRIFRATQLGDFKKVRSLQKLMLRSFSNRAVSVRRVTYENKGRNTAGVDKVLIKTPRSRAWLIDHLASVKAWKAKPARRVYIPKANGKQRPLGIPVIFDRGLQAMVKNALEPSWEARFEGSSYGFRPGRGCHDALQQIFFIAKGVCRKRWVLDADIKGAFDNISHEHLLKQLEGFPQRDLIHQWLKAGYMEMGSYHPTEAGTGYPLGEGGVASPLLANIALHGMEEALGIRYDCKGHNQSDRALVRYADDFVVFCKTEGDAYTVKELLTGWLKERGLVFSEEKTRIVHLSEGLDFLSVNVRQHEAKNRKSGRVLLMRPSREAVKRRIDGLKDVWRSLQGVHHDVVCKKLNPIVKGWANYHRKFVASRTFHALDGWMYRKALSHLRRNHPGKTLKWFAKKGYLGRLHPTRADNYVYGDKSKDTYLLKFSWFPIERHIKVKGTNSPDDPDLREYWERRRLDKIKRICDRRKRILTARQHGLCWVCGESILEEEEPLYYGSSPEEVHRHRELPGNEGGTYSLENVRLVHLYCHQQIHANRNLVGMEQNEAA
jgi:RNA-directed DNA polymerase